MDSPVEKLYALTEDMVQRLDQVSEEELVDFVEQRNQLIEQMKQLQLSDQERLDHAAAVKQILDWDKLVMARMEMLKQLALSALNRQASSNAQKGAYEQDYTPDSLFFDRKK